MTSTESSRIAALVARWAKDESGLPLGGEDPMVDLIAKFVGKFTLSPASDELVAAASIYLLGLLDSEIKASYESLSRYFNVRSATLVAAYDKLLSIFLLFIQQNACSVCDGDKKRREILAETPLSKIKAMMDLDDSDFVVVDAEGEEIQFLKIQRKYHLIKATKVKKEQAEESKLLLKKKL